MIFLRSISSSVQLLPKFSLKRTDSGHVPVFFLFFLFALIAGCSKDDGSSVPFTGTMTDTDGNVYTTVKIGDQWWMAENLRVARYSNGDSIPMIGTENSDSVWATCSSGAYCILDAKFGFLYNFKALTDSRSLAPAGWHVPSDDEWKELELYLGMPVSEANKLNWRGTSEGDKMKAAGGNTSDWAKSADIYTIFGTNESGFGATGGACRMFNGQWGELTHTGFWWSSTLSEGEVYYRSLEYNKSGIFRYKGSPAYGFSIRLVKDKG
jgi:uncharacterized protein (TIGR02145 family)